MRYRHLLLLAIVFATEGCALLNVALSLQSKGARSYPGDVYDGPPQAAAQRIVDTSPAAGTASGSQGIGGATGLGVSVGAGRQMDDRTSVGGQLGYIRLGFDGGHDNLYTLGARVRRDLTESEGPTPFVGAGGSLVHETSATDGVSTSPSANGFILGGHAGVRLPAEGFVVNVFAGASYFRIGDLKSNGTVFSGGGGHRLLELGVELQKRR